MYVQNLIYLPVVFNKHESGKALSLYDKFTLVYGLYQGMCVEFKLYISGRPSSF